MTSDLDTKAAEIRAGLEGVTPGPWVLDGHNLSTVLHMTKAKGDPEAKHVCGDYEDVARCSVNWAKDAAHIARLDPATVLAFLDERAELLRERDGWSQRARFAEMRLTTAESTIASRDERIAALEGALNVITGCFDAAYAEGLQERLVEADNDVGSLRDLVERRLLFAHPVARALTEGGPAAQ